MLSENLLDLRRFHGYSQEEVAERIGVSRQAVAKWENGTTTPDINNCVALAHLYNVSLDDLVNFERQDALDLMVPPKGKYLFGTVKVNEKGQIVIPAKARNIFHIEPGTELLLLPISKGEIVKARFFTAVLLEGLTLILTVPFGVLRQSLSVAPNAVGMEANIAFLGFSLILLGLFNFVFFIGYYKDIQKVGKAFVGGSAAMFLYIVVVEAMTHGVPFFRDRLDTADPLFLWEKLTVLFFGLLVFSVLTILAYRISRRNFEKYDLA